MKAFIVLAIEGWQVDRRKRDVFQDGRIGNADEVERRWQRSMQDENLPGIEFPASVIRRPPRNCKIVSRHLRDLPARDHKRTSPDSGNDVEIFRADAARDQTGCIKVSTTPSVLMAKSAAGWRVRPRTVFSRPSAPFGHVIGQHGHPFQMARVDVGEQGWQPGR